MVAPIDPAALDRERFADVEELLVTWVRAALSGLGVAVSTELPAADQFDEVLAGGAGYVHIEVFGGADTNPATDMARVDVDVYVAEDLDGNPNRVSASDLAERLRAALLFHLPGYDSGRAVVSNVVTFSRPSARPYDDNPTLRRFGASYQVTVKSHN